MCSILKGFLSLCFIQTSSIKNLHLPHVIINHKQHFIRFCQYYKVNNVILYLYTRLEMIYNYRCRPKGRTRYLLFMLISSLDCISYMNLLEVHYELY